MLGSLFPNWFASIPLEKDTHSTDEWCRVVVHKRDRKGNNINGEEGCPLPFYYVMETSSGDLYDIHNRQKERTPLYSIAIKAMLIFFLVPLYALGMITIDFMRVVICVSSIFFHTFLKYLFKREALSLKNHVIKEVTKIVENVYRLIKVPVYTVKMMGVSVYTFLLPLRGRKWFKVELDWHEGTTYQKDIRRKDLCCKKGTNCMSLLSLGSIMELLNGKVLYLTYCMQKRGNIHEMVIGGKRFEVLKEM